MNDWLCFVVCLGCKSLGRNNTVEVLLSFDHSANMNMTFFFWLISSALTMNVPKVKDTLKSKHLLGSEASSRAIIWAEDSNPKIIFCSNFDLMSFCSRLQLIVSTICRNYYLLLFEFVINPTNIYIFTLLTYIFVTIPCVLLFLQLQVHDNTHLR